MTMKNTKSVAMRLVMLGAWAAAKSYWHGALYLVVADYGIHPDDFMIPSVPLL